MTMLIKMTQDGRRVEVIGVFVCLDGKPESGDVVGVIDHPRRFQILQSAPDATYVAGRIALTSEEAAMAKDAIWANEARLIANPSAVAGRLQAAMHRHAWEQGIE